MLKGNVTDLEKQFKEVQKKASKEIKKYEDEALISLRKAIDISEQYGIPYYFSITDLNNQYVPYTFKEKWNELPSKILRNYEIVASETYYGWQHSDIC